MDKPKLILVGGGGHCKACIDVIEMENKYQILGILDTPEKKGQKVFGYTIIGSDSDIPKYIEMSYLFLITIGYLGGSTLREKIFNNIIKIGGKLAKIVSPLAFVSLHARIGDGTIIMHHAIINAGAEVSYNCIINSKALVEHEAYINSNSHVSTLAVVNGMSKVGSNCFLGSGTIVNQSIEITENTIIGSGGIVTNDITESGTYVGIPVKKIR